MFLLLRNFLDSLINFFKWPIGVLMFLGLYPITKGIWFYYQNVPHDWDSLSAFGGGFLAVILIWIYIINRKNIILATIEHEFTHALFAWFTFHPVIDFRASFSGAGSMSFRGKGNWLIAIAPYFFPTMAVAVVCFCMLVSFIARQEVTWLNIALGFALGYHFLATSFEIHKGQTDLQKVGFLFSFMFLPSANLLSYALLIAFVDKGWTGLIYMLKVIAYTAYNWLVPSINYVLGLLI